MSNFNPVARTAFYCAALRAADAQSSKPVCGDTFAVRFIDEETRRDLEPVLGFRNPAASNVARHRLIDDLVREAFAQDPARRIILLGAGFDTRAFRLPGGNGGNLKTRNCWRSRRSACREGVTMYLPDPVLRDLAAAVRASLPRATLVADLMSPAFARRFAGALRRELTRLGAIFAVRSEHPRHAIEAAGYLPRQAASIAERARAAGTMAVPGWLLATLLRELRDGYAVWTFIPAA